jgi:hypothetical protein
MAAAALVLPHEIDWAVWDWLGSRHEPVFDAGDVALVDVPWDPGDLAKDRSSIASFLRELVAQKQNPSGVILDVQFAPCQTRPCGEQMTSARKSLIDAIRSATSTFGVYALEQPELRADDTATALEPHDPDIYAALTGAGHSRFTVMSEPRALFYRACYDVAVGDAAGASVATQSVWSVVDRVLMRPGESTRAPCDPSHVAVRLPADALSPVKANVVALSSRGAIPPGVRFERKYVIVGTLSNDPGYDKLRGPEVLAWALSNALDRGTAAAARADYDTEPQNAMLLVLVPAFSALTLVAFVAIFFGLRGLRLARLRRALPWLAAIAAALTGLAAFALFEGWLLASGHIQPQVALVALGVLLTAALAGLRAYGAAYEQTWARKSVAAEAYDYDVFISYAHDEGAWVSKHVEAPFRAARLADGSKLKVFIDKEDIRYGTAWQDEIAFALDASRYVVPVYSELYFQRSYCNFEIRRAHRKWINAGAASRCVLPIMRGHPVIPSAVDDIQAMSVDDVPDLVDRIVAEVVESLSGRVARADDRVPGASE